MNANSLLWCCLVAVMFPACVRAQTVDDIGNKWRLERDMRDEASLITSPSVRAYAANHGELPAFFPNLGDFVSQSIMKLIDEERLPGSLEAKEPLLRQHLEKLGNGLAAYQKLRQSLEKSESLKRRFKGFEEWNRAMEGLIRFQLNEIEGRKRERRERLEEMKRKARHDIL